MADRSPPGAGLTDRLMSRTGAGLASRRFSGIEVFSGPLARRALEALNARAFTMDGTIFVDPTFDPNTNQDDAGLLMHEDEHRRSSGGQGGGAAGHNDAEEKRARGVEMVTHQLMSQGASLEDVLREVRLGSASAALTGSAAQGAGGPAAALVSAMLVGADGAKDPMAAYVQMRAQGMPHRQIVDELSRHVMNTMDRMNQEHTARTGEGDFHKD